MYRRIPWELVADTLGSREHTMGTAGLVRTDDSPPTSTG